MGTTIRTFIALELPADVIQQAEAIQDQLKRAGLKLRWVRAQHMHLTLRFLGDIAPERSTAVVAAMQQAAAQVGPLSLTIQGLGVFPGIRNPRILWIGLGGRTDALTELRQRLDDALAGDGFTRENKPFKAHLTLARIKEFVDSRFLLQAIEACAMFTPVSFQSEEMVLFRSDLRPNGPVHTPLARVGFA
jgi:RNA 2',3'-cyclic 3'-phosphodiesterase